MKNILFLCTGNSCRSQMAEGWGKKYLSDKYNVYSAGTKTHGLNPRAVQVMKESGVDISGHTSKTTQELSDVKMDIVVTVCSDANGCCPYYADEKIVHVGFDDPPRLTASMTDENERLNVYRRVRDEIKLFIQSIDTYIGNV
jgi:arsenate reductase (thioredoxin)